MGVARQTYIDLENGKTEPRLSAIEKICTIFNLKPCYWFGGTEESKNLREMPNDLLLMELHRRLAGQRELPELTNYARLNMGMTQTSQNQARINNLQ
ncbi:hypothetical protein JCM19237_293 [Photobacterium aphoticum]|uniref:HTH cro/C1-type domain-containing protein n=1 Tax=Photobacterium aphoticum TaxID=754436 RepID=A0A090R062_9GAMM|nr:hypothetical protein JCM19237_293 [Photobacterium aphoticum]